MQGLHTDIPATEEGGERAVEGPGDCGNTRTSISEVASG
jgi:hypothetical protein